MDYEPIDVDAPIPFVLTDRGHREVFEIRQRQALWCATAHRVYREDWWLYCKDCPWESRLEDYIGTGHVPPRGKD